MMSSPFKDKGKRHRCIDEAGQWLVALQEDELADETKEAFADWLLSSTDHVREYLKIAMLGDDIASLSFSAAPTARELKAAIASEDPRAEVVTLFERTERLPDSEQAAKSGPGRKRFGGYRFAVAAAVAIVALGLSLFWPSADTPRAVYQTAIGEQSSLVLEDGSTLTLNTQTEVQVDFNANHRNLYLNSGEALFEVAKDATRPFRVYVDGAVIEAVGTEFNIRQLPERIEATLLEGGVKVHSGSDVAPMQLQVAEQAVINRSTGQLTVVSVDPGGVMAWRQRKLIFDGEPLKNAISEFNRYNSAKIVILDENLKSLPVSGVFNATDPDSFTLFLEAAGLARVNRSASGTVLASTGEE